MLINTRMPGARITLLTALSVALPFALITIFLLRLVIRSRHGKVTTGDVGLLGEIGTVEIALAPRGQIYVHGELWDAISPEPVSPGNLVQVKSVEGLTLQVEPIPKSNPGSAESQPSQETTKGA